MEWNNWSITEDIFFKKEAFVTDRRIHRSTTPEQKDALILNTPICATSTYTATKVT